MLPYLFAVQCGRVEFVHSEEDEIERESEGFVVAGNEDPKLIEFSVEVLHSRPCRYRCVRAATDGGPLLVRLVYVEDLMQELAQPTHVPASALAVLDAGE